MKRGIIILLVGFSAVFYSCSHSGSQRSKMVAKGNRSYGGTIHVNESNQIINLYPYYIYDLVSYSVACQIYDGLVRVNPKDLSIVPDIAKSWEIDPAGTLYTFHLNTDVTFQDDPCFSNGKGRKVTANDFKYSMEKLCTENPDNVIYAITFKNNVEGAQDYYEKSKKGTPSSDISGVKVLNDSTLQIKLIKKNPIFLKMLAGQAGFVIAKEGVEKYGRSLHLGTGPFMYSSTDSDKVILTANPNYFRHDSLGNQLPYLDSVIVTFMPERLDEFKAFSEGRLDYIGNVPPSQVDKMAEDKIQDFMHKPPKYLLSRISLMSTKYIGFNLSKAPFNDIRVRKAFSLAIDRNALVNDVLQGQAFGAGIHGIMPPSFMSSPNPDDNYDINNIKGDTLNVEMAKKLLSEAGFPDGKGFPTVTLELNSNGDIGTSVAVEIQKELKAALGVNINFNVVSYAQRYEDEKYMRYDLVYTGWTADFADPSDFLMLFLGANVPDSIGQPAYYNSTRYKNPEYDKLFEMGREATTTKEMYHYYQQAEQLAINDAPVAVLWHDQNYSLTKGYVKGLYTNSMNYVDYSCVYLIPREMTGDSADSTKKK